MLKYLLILLLLPSPAMAQIGPASAAGFAFGAAATYAAQSAASAMQEEEGDVDDE